MPSKRDQLNFRPPKGILDELDAIHDYLTKLRGPRSMNATVAEVIRTFHNAMPVEHHAKRSDPEPAKPEKKSRKKNPEGA